MTTSFTPGTKIECPCCGKSVNISKSGIPRHGYKTDSSGFSALANGCPARGAKTVSEALTAQRAILTVSLGQNEQAVAELQVKQAAAPAGIRVMTRNGWDISRCERMIETLRTAIANIDAKLAA